MGWREPVSMPPEPAGDPVRRAPRGRGVRRPVAAVASALVVFASVALFVGIYSRARREVSVVVVARAVGAGTPVTMADVAPVRVALGGSVTAIPYRDLSDVVGRWAAEPLIPGTLLAPSELSGPPGIPTGSAEVGVVLKPGQLPAAGLRTGDRVMVVDAGSALGVDDPGTIGGGSTGPDLPSTTAEGSAVLVPRAAVVGTAPPPAAASSGAVEVVSLRVPTAEAAPVGVAAAAGTIVLALVPGGDPAS
jgi:hypothetical protein